MTLGDLLEAGIDLVKETVNVVIRCTWQEDARRCFHDGIPQERARDVWIAIEDLLDNVSVGCRFGKFQDETRLILDSFLHAGEIKVTWRDAEALELLVRCCLRQFLFWLVGKDCFLGMQALLGHLQGLFCVLLRLMESLLIFAAPLLCVFWDVGMGNGTVFCNRANDVRGSLLFLQEFFGNLGIVEAVFVKRIVEVQTVMIRLGFLKVHGLRERIPL